MQAILKSLRGDPPYAIAALVSASILSLYVLTIAPTTQFWDTSEYMAAAKVLGIPHPPGNPLFVLLANVWAQIPIVEHYALRLNLFAAFTSAMSSGLLFLVAERLLRPMMPDAPLPRYAAAIAGIFVGAFAFTVWNQSVVNEKVYTLSLLSISLVLWLATRWVDQTSGRNRDRLLILILYLLALSSTNHSMGLLAAPAVAVFLFGSLLSEGAPKGEWAKWVFFCITVVLLVFLPDIMKGGATQIAYYLVPAAILTGTVVFATMTGQWKIAAAGLLVVVLGLSLNWFLYIRAGMFPPINEGEPTNWEALRAVLTREQYQKGPLLPRQADLAWQYANYLQYFSWQFGRTLESPAARYALTFLFGCLGLLGAAWHWIRDRNNAAALTVLMGTVTVALVFYLDFKYGYSIRPGENLLREVRERDYFFIASFQLWGVWAALGFGTLLYWGGHLMKDALDKNRRWLPLSPLLLLALVPLLVNWRGASRAGETLPRDVAWDMLQSVEPYSILVTAGDNDTFPLWYAQEVEGIRQDVLIANLSLMNTDWHVRQLKRQEARPFEPEEALDLFRDITTEMPTEDALSLTFEELDALPPYLRIEEARSYQKDSLIGVLEPQVLERADLVMISLIQDNLGKRPIYISRTTGGFAERMGLAPYLLGQGLVRKLMPQPVRESDSVKLVSSLGWLDLETTRTLLFDAYHHESFSKERPDGWLDEPSGSIITLYFIIYQSYSETLSILSSDPTTGFLPDSTTSDLITRSADIAADIYRNTSLYRRD